MTRQHHTEVDVGSLLPPLRAHWGHEPPLACVAAPASWTAAVLCRFRSLRLAGPKRSRHVGSAVQDLAESRRDSMKIAQRFNAGFKAPKRSTAPPGAAETKRANRSAAPTGLAGFINTKPSVETLGYSRMSLRDKDLRQRHANSRRALELVRCGTRPLFGAPSHVSPHPSFASRLIRVHSRSFAVDLNR